MIARGAQRLRAVALLGVIAWFAPLAASAAGAPAPARERGDFLAAEHALATGHHREFARLLAGLADYPLRPYLVYEDLVRRLARARPAEVERFLADNASTPLAARLRAAWLGHLAKARRWRPFLDAWRADTDPAMRCRHVSALLATGREDAAFAALPALWLAGESRPDECDAPFAAFARAGRLTPALAWGRIRLAMRAGDTRLARYLERFLPAGERALAREWRRVRRDPDRARALAGRAGPHRDRVEEILLDAVERVADRDPERAASLWHALGARFAFGARARHAAVARIAFEYAVDQDRRALDWYARLPAAAVDTRAAEWRVLAALRQGEWRRAIAWIDAMPAALRAESRWRYWRARALGAAGDEAGARAGYRAIAGERDYYGFLAADRIGARYHFGEHPIEIPAAVARRVASDPAVARARELIALDRRLDAYREWWYLVDRLDDAERVAAARLARDWGWPGRAILTIARTPHRDDLELRFPVAFRASIERAARAARLDPAWLFAIARQESAFVTDARSPKGALGLMQILPRTGRSIARALDTRLVHAAQLFDADTSARFGAYYLRSLLDRLGGHPVLATAAYNAGPHRVEGWEPATESVDADLWIEQLPFSETRRYVRRVFAYTAVYEHRLGRTPVRLSARLVPVPGRAIARGAASGRRAGVAGSG